MDLGSFLSIATILILLSSPLHTPIKPPSLAPQQFPVTQFTGTDRIDYIAIAQTVQSANPAIPTSEIDTITSAIITHSRSVNIDPKLAAALFAQESSFVRTAVSPVGAKGIGQLMNPEGFGVRDPFDIDENISASVTYLAHLISRWKDSPDPTGNGIASYYSGYTGVQRMKGAWDPTTTAYVKAVLRRYQEIQDRSNASNTGK